MKKLALSTLALAAGFALTAGTTLAFVMPGHHQMPKKDPVPVVKVESKNVTHIKSEVKSEADTGDNKVVAGSDYKKPSRTYGYSYNKPNGGEAIINTGDADSFAGAEIYAGDNSTEVTAPRKGTVYVGNNNFSYVNSYVRSEAETGDNSIYSKGGDAKIKTGNAISAGSAFIMVGSNVTKIN